MNKKKVSVNWSLRGMLLVVTLLSAMLAWKYNQRNRILSATNQVRLAGGEVTYRFQNPLVATKTARFTSRYAEKPHEVTRTLSDGSTVTERVQTSLTLAYPVSVNTVNTSGNSKPNNSIFRFMSNSDIFVDAVRIPELNVDRKFVAALQDLDGLRIVQICRTQQYFRTIVARPSSHQITLEQRQNQLSELSKPFEDSKSIIQQKLPHVQIIDCAPE